MTAAPDIALDPARFERTMRRYRIWERWFQPTLVGVDNLPAGGALIVSNHGTFGFDLSALVRAVWLATGRPLRSLGDHIVFRTPGIRRLAHDMGIVEGTPDHAHALLTGGAWVLVYPGGAREAMPSASERYQLFWDGSHGFAETAIRAQVPIVPMAGIGVDDVYDEWISRDQIAATRLGQWVAQTFGEKYVFPIYRGLGPLPKPVSIRYVFGAPIPVPKTASEANRKRLHKRVRDVTRALIDRELAKTR
ncbi:MAG: acyltransferase family protein [Candidatus Dadabacteria bacterium]|nr:MAG: acyltransferase family protein [Candidatus Dadabacteria bacterium]